MNRIGKAVAAAVIAALWISAPGLPCYQAMAQGLQSGANPGAGAAAGSVQPGIASAGVSLLQPGALLPGAVTAGRNLPPSLGTGSKVGGLVGSARPSIRKIVPRPAVQSVLGNVHADNPSFSPGEALPPDIAAAKTGARETLDLIHETAAQPGAAADAVAASRSLSQAFDQERRHDATTEDPVVGSPVLGEIGPAQKASFDSALSPFAPRQTGNDPSLNTNDLIDPDNLGPLLRYDEKTWTKKLNLHAHSRFSDGELSPEALAQKLFEAGLTEVALTDHDTLDGQERFVRACLKLGLKVHPGVELTAGEGTHIVVLDPDIYDAKLAALLERTKEWRLERAKAYIAYLNALPELQEKDIVITLREVLAKTINGMIERPHIAQVLVDKGLVKTVDEAFRKYIGFDIKDPEVLELEPKPDQVMAAVRSSGGKAFLAHPYSIPPGAPSAKELLGMGMHGIEGYRPGSLGQELSAGAQQEARRSQSRLRRYLLIAHDMNLLVMPGSDYHGPGTHLNQFVVPMPKTLAGQIQAALERPHRRSLDKIQEKFDKDFHKAETARSIKAALAAGTVVALPFLWTHLTLGIAGSILLSFGGVPQIWKNYREGITATKDLSFPSFLIWFSATILLTASSILKQSNIAWILSNVSGIFRSSIIIGQIGKTRHDPSIIKKALQVAIALGSLILPAFLHLLLSPAIWASIFFGGALALIMVLNMPQIRDNYLNYHENRMAPKGLQWLSTAVVTAGNILHFIAAASTANVLWMAVSATAIIMTSIILGQLFLPSQTHAALRPVMPAFLRVAGVIAAAKDQVVLMARRVLGRFLHKEPPPGGSSRGIQQQAGSPDSEEDAVEVVSSDLSDETDSRQQK